MKQHDDHVDNLVHDSPTSCLHLEHVNCNKCGQNDVHGVFQCVSQQRWQDGAATDGGVVQVHFFETSSRPFSVIDFHNNHDVFDSTSHWQVIAAAAHSDRTEDCTSS